jgi:type II secretory pathway pseudopilin PulG
MKVDIYKKMAGLTLLELLMAVGIAAVIAIASLVIYRSVDRSNRVLAEIKSLKYLEFVAVDLYRSQGDFNGGVMGLMTDMLIESGRLPKAMLSIDGSPNLNSTFAQDSISVNADAVSGGATFNISESNIPNDVCVDFGSKLFQLFTQIQINMILVTNVGGVVSACTQNALPKVFDLQHIQ